MRKLLLVGIGGAIGYVLGARAGRPAYNRITDAWRSMTERSGMSEALDTVGGAGADVRDAVLDQTMSGMKDAAATVGDSMHQAATKIRSASSN